MLDVKRCRDSPLPLSDRLVLFPMQLCFESAGMDEGGRDHFDRDFGGETGKSCSVSNKETTDIGCAFLGWTAGQKLRGAA